MSQLSKPYFEAFHNRLNFIYDCSCEDCNSQKQQINLSLDDDFKSILNIGKLAYKKLFENGKYNPKDLKTVKEYQDLIDENYKILNFAIQDNDMPKVMRTALQNDAFMFGGLKTHAQLTEVSQLLLNSDGKQKLFSEVQNDFNKLNLQYNQNYLQSEYQFATSSAQMASKWVDLDDTGRYNLQYRTAGDNRVRPEHQALRDITLPKDDPFWNSFYPPNGWKCRCTAVEILKDKYPISDSGKAIDAGNKATTQIGKDGKNRLEIFRFNPGATQKLMPPKHPVNATRCSGDGKLSITGLIGAPIFILSLEKDKCEASKIIAEMRINKNHPNRINVYNKPIDEQYKILYKSRNGGNVKVHELVNRTADDYREILKSAKEFAKLGKQVRLLPEVDYREVEARLKIFPSLKVLGKNPDLLVDNEYIDLKRPSSIKNIAGKANEAVKQGASALISDIKLDNKLSDKVMIKRARDIFNNKFYTSNNLYFIRNGKLTIYNRTGDK